MDLIPQKQLPHSPTSGRGQLFEVQGRGRKGETLSKETGAGGNSPEFVKSLVTKCRNFVQLLPKQLAITDACGTTHPQSFARSHPDQPADPQRSRLLTRGSPEQPRAGGADPFPPAFQAHTAAPSVHRGGLGTEHRPLSLLTLRTLERCAPSAWESYPASCTSRGRAVQRRLQLGCQSSAVSPRPLAPSQSPRLHPGPAHPTPPASAPCPWLRPPGCGATEIPEAGSRPGRPRGGAQRSRRRLLRVCRTRWPGVSSWGSHYSFHSFILLKASGCSLK